MYCDRFSTLEICLSQPPSPAIPRADVLTAYRRMTGRRVMVVLGLSLLCVVAFLLDLTTGPSAMTAGQVLRGLFDPDSLTAPQAAIVWQGGVSPTTTCLQ